MFQNEGLPKVHGHVCTNSDLVAITKPWSVILFSHEFFSKHNLSNIQHTIGTVACLCMRRDDSVILALNYNTASN